MGTQIHDVGATVEAIRPETALSYRLLGATGMVGAPMMLITMVLDRAGRLPGGMMGRSDGLLSIVYAAGWLCTALAMRQQQVFGRGKVAAAASAVQITGLMMAGVWAALVAVHPHPNPDGLLFRITDPMWPLSHVFMLVLGAAAITARRWTGWRRYTPLACGLVVPFALVAAWVGQRPAMETVFGIHTAVAWTALGWAVFTGTDVVR